MTQRASNTARRAGLIAVAVALAAALAAARARLAGRAPATSARDRARAALGRLQRSADQTYSCRCGTSYRVSGTDRHRVYWPTGAPDDAPVLGDRCVECDAPLPGGRATHAA